MALALPTPFIHLQIPLLYLNNILGLAIGTRHHVLRLGVTFPVLVLLVSQSLYREWSGTYGIRYGLECFVLCMVWTHVDWVVLGSPDKEGWKKIRYGVQEKKTGDGEKEVVPQSFWARAWWGARLATGNRHVGWTQQVKNVRMEVDADYPRWRFIVRKSLRVALFYFLSDMVVSYTVSTPHGSWSDIEHIKPALSYADRPFLERIWFAWVHIVITYTELEKANAAFGVVCVAIGFANPRDCPSMFGDLKVMYTVRKAWSAVWHQQCRRICSAPGVFLARDVLRLRKGSFASKYLQLFIGFGISGLIHGGAHVLIYRSLLDDGSLAFFLQQAVIIMIEDHAIEFGKALGFRESSFWRAVGFVWAAFAVGATGERWVGITVINGGWVHDRRSDWMGMAPKIAT